MIPASAVATLAGRPGSTLGVSVKARQQLAPSHRQPIYAARPRHGVTGVATVIETHRSELVSCVLSKFTQYRRVPLWLPMNEPKFPRCSTA